MGTWLSRRHGSGRSLVDGLYPLWVLQCMPSTCITLELCHADCTLEADHRLIHTRCARQDVSTLVRHMVTVRRPNSQSGNDNGD